MDIRELLDICIDKNLIDITISSRKSKDDSRVQKVKIRPVIIKDSIEFQVSEFVGKKVLHTNLSADDVKGHIEKYMEEFMPALISMTESPASFVSCKINSCSC